MDLVVVGPEAPLVAGVADALRAAGIPVLRPGARRPRGSRASKAFAKEVMLEAGVPTADVRVVHATLAAAEAYARGPAGGWW